MGSFPRKSEPRHFGFYKLTRISKGCQAFVVQVVVLVFKGKRDGVACKRGFSKPLDFTPPRMTPFGVVDICCKRKTWSVK